ncbi:MAG: thioredoxin [Rhizobacter sp.]|nr:thioredoxin [Rhizobacter sp.]
MTAALNDFFESFDMRPVSADGFDQALVDAGDALVVVYFWGDNCFNCDQFKKAALIKQAEIRELGLHWLQADVYADSGLRRRFALHGVPTFYVFHRSRKIGRITSWPGIAAFGTAMRRQQQQIREQKGEPASFDASLTLPAT